MQRIAIVLLATLAWACTHSKRPADGFEVAGSIATPVPGQAIALYKVSPEGQTLVDSLVPEDGKFSFVGKVAGLQMFALAYAGQQYYFVANNQDVKVDITGSGEAQKATIEAGEEQRKLETVLSVMTRQARELAPMRYEYELALVNRDPDRAARYRGMIERGLVFFRGRFRHLADSLAPSYAAYTATTRLSLRDDFSLMDSVGKKLEVAYPKQPWVASYLALLNDARALAPGQPAPGFLLPSAKDSTQLYGPEVYKGKVLVLDFWASWCGPCRKAAPEMVALYAKYKSKGVQFLGVSLDQKRDAWLRAIAEDNLAWPQCSDLRFWDNAAARAFKIESIPAIVVLDRQGRIAATGLEPATLDEKLAEMTTAF